MFTQYFWENFLLNLRIVWSLYLRSGIGHVTIKRIATEVKLKKLLAVSELRLKEIEEFIDSEDIDDVKNAYEQLDELIKRL